MISRGYKLSCNQHSIHRAIQHTLSSWKSQSVPLRFSHLLFPRGHTHSQPGHATVFKKVNDKTNTSKRKGTNLVVTSMAERGPVSLRETAGIE